MTYLYSVLGYEPTQEKKKLLKKQNKVSKRDNVVMFDNPMQYQNAGNFINNDLISSVFSMVCLTDLNHEI